jgi:hypothetical protein
MKQSTVETLIQPKPEDLDRAGVLFLAARKNPTYWEDFEAKGHRMFLARYSINSSMGDRYSMFLVKKGEDWPTKSFNFEKSTAGAFFGENILNLHGTKGRAKPDLSLEEFRKLAIAWGSRHVEIDKDSVMSLGIRKRSGCLNAILVFIVICIVTYKM